MSTIKCAVISASSAAAIGLAAPALANNLLVNGGFETGDFTGWSASSQTPAGQFFVVPNNGDTGPRSGLPYAFNPAGGNFFALSDQGNPSSTALTQSFTLSSTATVQVSFDFFANNWDGGPYNNGRDVNTTPNQNAEVDILTGAADPFTNSGSDIVATLWGPGGDPIPIFSANPNPWVTYTSALSLAAGTYQIRFAETDNQGNFNIGVDNVSISTAIPEPSTWALLALGFAGLGCAGYRASRKSEAFAA
jgi:hypothetical protein